MSAHPRTPVLTPIYPCFTPRRQRPSPHFDRAEERRPRSPPPEVAAAKIYLNPEQVPLVIEWLSEAAGNPPLASGRKLGEIKTQAHLFRRLQREAQRNNANPDVQGVFAAIRTTLEWAAGESDLSPDEWWQEVDGGNE